jgi:hypothetical protein
MVEVHAKALMRAELARSELLDQQQGWISGMNKAGFDRGATKAPASGCPKD